MKKPSLLVTLGFILVALALIFGGLYYQTKRELTQQKKITAVCQQSSKILDFTNLFMSKVLLANKEVDFTSRLELEKAVKDLSNAKISAAWKAFTDSQDEQTAQANAEALLTLLLSEANVRQ